MYLVQSSGTPIGLFAQEWPGNLSILGREILNDSVNDLPSVGGSVLTLGTFIPVGSNHCDPHSACDSLQPKHLGPGTSNGAHGASNVQHFCGQGQWNLMM